METTTIHPLTALAILSAFDNQTRRLVAEISRLRAEQEAGR